MIERIERMQKRLRLAREHAQTAAEWATIGETIWAELDELKRELTSITAPDELHATEGLREQMTRLHNERYRNGCHIEILPGDGIANSGPHRPNACVDEVELLPKVTTARIDPNDGNAYIFQRLIRHDGDTSTTGARTEVEITDIFGGHSRIVAVRDWGSWATTPVPPATQHD